MSSLIYFLLGLYGTQVTTVRELKADCFPGHLPLASQHTLQQCRLEPNPTILLAKCIPVYSPQTQVTSVVTAN